MHQRCASWLEEPLHTPPGVLHKTPFSDEALFRFTPQYEASPQCSDMKHSLRSYDQKMKNESFSSCNRSLVLLYYRLKGKLLMEKNSNKLVDLSVAFAVEILNLVKYLQRVKTMKRGNFKNKFRFLP